jgi:CRP-like cAMP-binding protein
VARLSTPGFFGEMALLTGEPRTASVLALCDTTVVSMERHDFADLFEHHPELAALLADVLARRRQGLAEALAEACKPGSPPAHESSQLLDRLRHIFRQLT